MERPLEWLPKTRGVARIIRGRWETKPWGEEEEVIKPVAMLPYCSTIVGRLEHLLCRINIKTVFCPLTKISQMMALVKNPLGLNVPGVDQIPCACGWCYISQMG